MKIAYITEVNITIDSGISKKLQQQVAGWERMGHEVMIFSLAGIDYSGRNLPAEATLQHSKVYTFNAPLLKRGVKNFLNKAFSGYRLEKDLRQFSPDVVYYRQGMWFPALDGIMKEFPAVMEVNTVDTEEYLQAGRLKRGIYMFGRKRILKRLKGMICVTDEIGRKYWQYHIPTAVISNGIDLSSLNGEALKKEMQERPQLIFVGSPGMDWQGVDKVLQMAGLLPQFDFHIVGEKREDITSVPGNVRLYGYLSSAELRQLYGAMDVGIGTLALYRKKMEEACPLKVREYCRYGLPVICAYYDTDLAGQEYMLRLENAENNIVPNLERIRDFVNHWHNRRINPATLRGFLDTTVKENGRIEFFKRVVAGNILRHDS